MAKIKINNNAFTYPQPVFLIGAIVNNKANFMPASWVSRVHLSPNIMMVSLNPERHTYQGIREHKVFTINVPNIDLVTKTDYCALVSGKTTDKSMVFDVFSGELENAPLIQECPICAECKLIKEVSLTDHQLMIGEVINTYLDETCLTDKNPDILKIRPFTFTMPDSNYWFDGRNLGKAWNIGKAAK